MAVLTRQKPDRVPTDYWATGEFNEALCAHLGCSLGEAFERLHIDKPAGVGDRYVGPPPEEGADIWGVRRTRVDYGAGAYDEIAYSPLAQYNSVDEIEANYRWPKADDFDVSHLPEAVKGLDTRPVACYASEPFNHYMKMRGLEQSFIDLMAAPEIAHYILDTLFDLFHERLRRILETIPDVITYTYVAEDLGSQSSLLFSTDQIDEFLLPGMKRMMDLTRGAGAYVFTHSDGAIRDVIPALIETGTQILNPIQWRCAGMEREGLKRDFGDKLIFHGAMDNQQTLPFGSIEEVRREVHDNLRILGAGGGYILAPCHNIQAVSPPENIVAMYETAYEEGWT
jgi:uroporphyrinogen decarboxylase